MIKCLLTISHNRLVKICICKVGSRHAGLMISQHCFVQGKDSINNIERSTLKAVTCKTVLLLNNMAR